MIDFERLSSSSKSSSSKKLNPRKMPGRDLPITLKSANQAQLEWQVAASIQAGDVVMYDVRTVHADCLNRSDDSPQLSLECRYIVD